MSSTESPIVPLEECRRFIADCVERVGASKENAKALADLLSEADYRGHYSHGMNRLEFYLNDIRKGLIDPNAAPRILRETPATAWVDGGSALGAVVAGFCTELAISKARRAGVGWVVAKGSNHFGIAGMHSGRAMREGLIGMSFTNGSPAMCPTRAKQAALGTNPLSVAAPAGGGDGFVLDMATTAVAFGKVEMQLRKGEPVPEGWSQDFEGRPVTDPKQAIVSPLLPLGGREESSGYKGYGLSLMVEVLCGILGGANYGPNIPWWGKTDLRADLGQCFVALDPGCFAPGFEGRLQDLLETLRGLERVDPEKPVLVAGDPERAHMARVDEEGGVRYVRDQWEACSRLARELGVEPLRHS